MRRLLLVPLAALALGGCANELRVPLDSLDAQVDASGDVGCDAVLSDADAATRESGTLGDDLRIELSWHALHDPDATGAGPGDGPDLDLHLLHPQGCWEDRRWDCHFRTPTPDWGDPRVADDDPALDIDSTDGRVSETILLREAEPGRRYTVGVHYYSDHGFGTAVAAVRIWFGGGLVYDDVHLLRAPGAFWEVARIEWPDRVLRVVDRVTDGVPTCE